MIIGATGSLGEASAIHFLEIGFGVVLCGRSTEKLSALKSTIVSRRNSTTRYDSSICWNKGSAASNDENILCVEIDLSNTTSIANAIDRAFESTSMNIVAVVNCAGTNSSLLNGQTLFF